MKRPKDTEPCYNCVHWVNDDCELGRYNSTSLTIFGYCGKHEVKVVKKSHYEVSCYDEDCKVPSNVFLYEDLQQAKQKAEELSKDYHRVDINQAFFAEDFDGAIDWENVVLIERRWK